MNQHVFGGTDRSCASLCSSPRWPILAWIFVVPSCGAEFDCEAADAVAHAEDGDCPSSVEIGPPMRCGTPKRDSARRCAARHC